MARLIAPAFEGYRASWLRPDLVAGLTVWAVLVPESLAYATIAGVSPVIGLYAAIPSLVLYALVGTSRHLVVAPMSATAALSASVIATVAGVDVDPAALTAALAVATGLVALAAGFLRLGFLASFISEPVLKGFIIGLALTIMIGQVPDLLGVSKGSGDFFEKTAHILGHLDEADLLTVTVGLGSLAVLLVLRRWLPIVPGSLAVALGAIVLASVLDLEDHGLELVGHIDSGLPDLGIPDVSGPDFLTLLGGSVGVMLVGFAEGLGAAKTYAAMKGYDIDANRELLGLGASNLGAGLASGMAVNGSLSKTAVNGSAGARSPMSPVTAAALTLLTLLFLTGLFERLPEATLAAIVIAAVIELVDLGSLRRLVELSSGPLAKVHRLTARADFLAAVAALLGVLVFDTLPGLVIGVGVSILLLIARTSRPYLAVLAPVERDDGADGGPARPGTAWVDVQRNADYTQVEGVLVIRVDGPLVFANADFVRTEVRGLVRAASDIGLVVLDGRTTSAIDVTAVAMLTQLRSDLRRRGVELALAENIGQVRDILDRADAAGEPRLYASVEEAIGAFKQRQSTDAHTQDGPATQT